MLALRLRPKEVIHIGPDIEIHADKSVPSAGVIVGITAPKSVGIWREKCVPHVVETPQEADR